MTINEINKKFTTAKTTTEANLLLEQFLLSLKINTFSFTYYAYQPRSANKSKYEFTSQNLQLWHKYYVAENYDYIDTTLDKAYQSTTPIYWTIAEQLRNAKTKAEKQMRLDSEKFGTEKGLSIPIHGPNNDFAILMVEQLRGQKCLENWQELQYQLLLIAHYYYNAIRNLIMNMPHKSNPYELSKREMQCLNLLVENYTLEQIAEKLAIAERTVNYHIQRINKKLGVKNKYQSIAKAFSENLL